MSLNSLRYNTNVKAYKVNSGKTHRRGASSPGGGGGGLVGVPVLGGNAGGTSD